MDSLRRFRRPLRFGHQLEPTDFGQLLFGERSMDHIAFDHAAVGDAKSRIGHVPLNMRGRFNSEIGRLNRTLDVTGDPNPLSKYTAQDGAMFSEEQRRAAHVANNPALYMKVNFGFDVAGDQNIRTDDRNLGLASGRTILSGIGRYWR